MDIEEYTQVWVEKYKDDEEKDPTKTVDNEDIAQYDSDDNVYSQPEASYRTDLAKHKMVWTGNFWPDMWFYTKQEHPLLSVCKSKSLHPLGKWERFFIELFVFALASMWAASVTQYMAKVKTEKQFVDAVAYMGYSILGGLIKTIVNSVLKVVATCTCFQEENTRARVKCELCGYVCMGVWGLISAGLFGLGLYFVVINDQTGEKAWGAWLLSLSISYISGWIIGFIIIFVTFIFGYYPCIKYDYKFGFVITYQDYLNWYDVHGEEYRDDEFEDDVGSSGRFKTKKSYEQVSTDMNRYNM